MKGICLTTISTNSARAFYPAKCFFLHFLKTLGKSIRFAALVFLCFNSTISLVYAFPEANSKLYIAPNGNDSWSDRLPESSSEANSKLYIAPNGNDSWSGRLPDPNGSDGPLATLEGARDRIRQNGWAGKRPMIINLRQGVYERSQAFLLESIDSGSPEAPVTYRSYPGEQAVISGGVRLPAAWSSYPDNPSIYVIDVSDIFNSYGPFNSFYVNSKRAIRARSPNNGYYLTSGIDTSGNYHFREGDISKDWLDLRKVEIVSFWRWSQGRFRIDRVEGDTVYAQGGPGFGKDYTAGKNRYYIENCFEALDQPGEWYLDQVTKKLYYWPLPEENMDRAECYVPVAKELVKLTGKAGDLVRDIHFSNLIFAHTDWALPAEGYYGGMVGGDNNNAGVQLLYARNIIFQDNCFTLLGKYGFSAAYSYRNSLKHNIMRDLGGGGIHISAGFLKNASGINTISDNKIYDINAVYKESPAIYLRSSIYDSVEHNEIYNTSYSAIMFFPAFYSFKQRPYIDPNTFNPDILPKTKIEYNHIHHVMRELNDGAGIYLYGEYVVPAHGGGVFYGTEISNNLIHDINKTSGHIAHNYICGIYLDSRVFSVSVHDNIVHTCGYGLHLAESRLCKIYNNIFANASSYVMVNRGKNFDYPLNLLDADGDIIERNIFFSTSNFWLFAIPPFRGAAPNYQTSIKESDHNLYYHYGYRIDIYPGSQYWNLDWWQDPKYNGFDTHSIVADPQFSDFVARDFSLHPDSPALKSISDGGIGFVPIDLSTVGPRGPFGDF